MFALAGAWAKTSQHNAVCQRVPDVPCKKITYILGEKGRRYPDTPVASLSPAQLAFVGLARRRWGPCTTSVSSPWTFVYNGTDKRPLSGCLPNVVGQCCEDIRAVYHMCQLSGVPVGTAFVIITGDSKPHAWWPHAALPVASGNRHVGGRSYVLPMQALRFYEEVTVRDPQPAVPWSRKRAELYWRGDSTGMEQGQSLQRARFVHALRRRGHDVAFYKWPIDNLGPGDAAGFACSPGPCLFGIERNQSGHVAALRYLADNSTVMTHDDIKPFVPISTSLQYKWLLCLEGNSMATAIAWMLASDSVVVMPPPTLEGWTLEGRLKPWVHYVPLESPDAIDVTIRWLREHDGTRVQRIIQNANEFIKKLRRQQPCELPPARGAGPPDQSWEWSELRDGPRREAEEMRRTIACIMDPTLTRALIEHAAARLADFEAGRGELGARRDAILAEAARWHDVHGAADLLRPEANMTAEAVLGYLG